MAKSIRLSIDGMACDQWESGEVTRDLKDFSGSFSFTFRDATRSRAALPFGTAGIPFYLRPGLPVSISIGGRPVLVGWLERVDPEISDRQAYVTISGRDKTGDLIDSSALVEGPAEFTNIKLEEAAKRIAKPFGLQARSEVDTGEPFGRYSLDLGETAFSAIEKGARSRHALILSDGIGGIVITRTGGSQAPAHLRLPGNVLISRGSFSHEGRFSETIVRGQSEFAGKDRTAASLSSDGDPTPAENRKDGDGSATERERKGTVSTGRAKDDEITRHRPTVHLARSKADQTSAQDEADWRSRTARGQSEEFTYTVKGHVANDRLWSVNQMAYVSDAFLMVERDMLTSRVSFIEDAAGAVSEITVTSPEAFDKEPVGNRRKNKTSKSKKSSGPLDGTASAL